MFRAGRLLKLPRNVDLNEEWEVDAVVNALLRRCQNNLDRGDEYGLVLGTDSETTGLHLILDRIHLFSFYSPEKITVPELGIYNEACAYVALGGTMGKQELISAMSPLLLSPHVIKCGANISGFDWFMFRNHGVEMADPLHDTIWMDWLANENRQHGLKKCMWDYFRFRMQDYKKAGSGEMDIRLWDYESALTYPGQDAFASYKVWEFLQDKLSNFFMSVGEAPSKRKAAEWREEGWETGWDFYQEFLVPVQRVVRNMMSRGVGVDVPYLSSLGEEVKESMQVLHGAINRTWEELQVESGKFYATDIERQRDKERVAKGLKPKFTGVENYRTINLNNTFMLRFMFFELMDYPVLKQTKPGATGKSNPSLDKEVLQEYADGHGCPYAKTILEYRNLAKLYGTYIGDEPDESVDGTRHKDKGGLRSKVLKDRVYTNFKIGPVTGRLASSGPNLMNIPARTELGRRVKKAFVPEDLYKHLCADYKQLEMRLFAHFADEPAMIQAILDGKDLHCVTASLMYGVPYEDLKEAKRKDDEREELTEYDKQLLEYRAAAKAIGFGLLYGMGPGKLSNQLNVTLDVAKDYIEKFFQAYPGAQKWMKEVYNDCEETGIVWTLLDRPRRLKEINSEEDWVRARAKRQAVNSVIQGSAADLVLSAMIRVDENERLKELGVKLLLQVHDELVLEVPEEHVEEATEIVQALMEYEIGDWGLKVPMPVSIHVGDNWAEAK